ncbi:MAG: lysoplasmalogenase [Gammaproteobacteria bacterium]|nr:lysoplasmalogenase [Gammaproteobacteria bacterium]
MIIQLFIAAIIVSGTAHIVADYKQKWSLTYLFKPLTMLLIIGLLLLKADLEVSYNQWILLGLVFSLVGDIFLMLRPQKFIAGLVSFLVAHLCYVYAFYQGLIGNDISWLAAVLLPIGIIYLAILWKHLGKYLWPVVAYFMAIGAMLFFASALFLVEMSLMTKLALLGAILFAISDAILAWRKFVKPLKYGQFYVMATYFSAQTLLTLSAIHYWT